MDSGHIVAGKNAHRAIGMFLCRHISERFKRGKRVAVVNGEEHALLEIGIFQPCRESEKQKPYQIERIDVYRAFQSLHHFLPAREQCCGKQKGQHHTGRYQRVAGERNAAKIHQGHDNGYHAHAYGESECCSLEPRGECREVEYREVSYDKQEYYSYCVHGFICVLRFLLRQPNRSAVL